MKLATIKKTSFIGLSILTFLIHFIYTWFPNTLTSIFFPVNESIWEHMKLLFTTIMIYGLIEFLIIKHFKIKYNNYLFSVFISALSSILIYLIMFLPFYYNGINNMIVYISVMIVTYIICSYISYYILNSKKIKYQNTISVVLIIICYIIFGYLTYNPLKNRIFLDTKDEKYGINDYII